MKYKLLILIPTIFLLCAFTNSPNQWGEHVTGVKTHLDTNKKVIALTFDACGGPKGNGYDKKLMDYLIANKIPATLFINARWIDANPKIFMELTDNPLFEIENHGLNHKPCSVNGKSIYGIKGTMNEKEVIDEIKLNGDKIYELTGRKPKYYRSGTAYYDETAVQIANKLGYDVINFDIIGDGGAKFPKDKIKQRLLSAKRGSIIICHFNQPDGDTAEGVIEAVPVLINKGYKFVRLDKYKLL